MYMSDLTTVNVVVYLSYVLRSPAIIVYRFFGNIIVDVYDTFDDFERRFLPLFQFISSFILHNVNYIDIDTMIVDLYVGLDGLLRRYYVLHHRRLLPNKFLSSEVFPFFCTLLIVPHMFMPFSNN